MNREEIYVVKEGEPTTFSRDNDLPKLPLPKLEDTLARYFETLKPFGTPEELENSRRIIDNFQTGIGRRLHKQLEEKAAKEKNWVEKWWEDYGYHTLRMPLHPYTVMAMTLLLETVNVPETHDYSLKAAARCIFYSLEFWDLIRREKIKPASSGKIFYSSALYKRFNATSRIPGVVKDEVISHLQLVSEGKGDGPTDIMITAKGRIFKMNGLNPDGSLLTQQQILACLQYIRGVVDNGKLGDCAPILTHDERTSWANNRKYLVELSEHNAATLKNVESSPLVVVLDDHEPKDYSESSALALTGDFYSKWADRSSILVVYKNGKLSSIGEHSCYDGTISISCGLFLLLSFYEVPEPNWDEVPKSVTLPVELKFDLDSKLKSEIERLMADCETRREEIIATHHIFKKFGKDFIKSQKVHPDAFVQVILQLTYFKLHNELAPTYETALMRQYHNGRTETLRACTTDCAEFVRKAADPKACKKAILKSFRKAVTTHDFLMNEARKGRAVDRHLFGLWCLAYEQNVEIPELYSDPLYSKSGGGGNFVLSTSTLGYTINTGFVGPMVLDGYGIFYSIPPENIVIQVTAYRASSKTSASKFLKMFDQNLLEMQELLLNEVKEKL